MAPSKKNQFEEDIIERLKAMEMALRKNKENNKKIKEDCANQILEIKENCAEQLSKIKEDYKKIKDDCANKISELDEKYKKIEGEYQQNIKSHNQLSTTYGQKNEPIHNTEISRPVFFGKSKDQHPKDFLYRLDEYFAIKQTYVGERIILVGDCLKAMAYNWFTTIRFQLNSYDDLKKVFLDEYWSREIQIQDMESVSQYHTSSTKQ